MHAAKSICIIEYHIVPSSHVTGIREDPTVALCNLRNYFIYVLSINKW